VSCKARSGEAGAARRKGSPSQPGQPHARLVRDERVVVVVEAAREAREVWKWRGLGLGGERRREQRAASGERAGRRGAMSQTSTHSKTRSPGRARG
jgi:hypothetical protein